MWWKEPEMLILQEGLTLIFAAIIPETNSKMDIRISQFSHIIPNHNIHIHNI